ncbi:MAG: hypothetical protein ACE5FA_14255, partial [Dehalococcoidia bacterium]
VLRGGGMLAIYALGTTVPLFLLAMVWDRLGLGSKKLLRGWGFKLGPISIHSTNLFAGVMFIVLGVFFIALQGTNALAATYESWGFTELSFQADEWTRNATSWIPDAAIFTGLGLLAVAGVVYAYRRLRPPDDGDWDEGDEYEDDTLDILPETEQA